MFLLILLRFLILSYSGLFFTFQYVSINTEWITDEFPPIAALHSNMFLLILGSLAGSAAGLLFTFHYVSINTTLETAMLAAQITLHSTMFLLIQRSRPDSISGENNFTFHYVSINTGSMLPQLLAFTFHYVSINTIKATFQNLKKTTLHSTMFLLIQRYSLKMELRYSSLHSTMFLLIPVWLWFLSVDISLYIPLCFY